MKTTYEKRTRLGINSMIFGVPKMKYRLLYWVALVILLGLGMLLG